MGGEDMKSEARFRSPPMLHERAIRVHVTLRQRLLARLRAAPTELTSCCVAGSSVPTSLDSCYEMETRRTILIRCKVSRRQGRRMIGRHGVFSDDAGRDSRDGDPRFDEAPATSSTSDFWELPEGSFPVLMRCPKELPPIPPLPELIRQRAR